MVDLSVRQIDIVRSLLTMPRTKTIKELASEFKVSSRTISGDLIKINQWVNEKEGINYFSQTGKGIWIECESESTRKTALDSLQNENLIQVKTKENGFIEQSIRIRLIIEKIIFSNNPVTGDDLSQMLRVSYWTVFSDIKIVKSELKSFNLFLNGKKGEGYTIEGDEIDIRTLMESLLQKHLEPVEYSKSNYVDFLLESLISIKKNPIINKKISNILSNVALILIDEFSNNYKVDIDMIVSMLSRLTIIVWRSGNKKYISDRYKNTEISDSIAKIYCKVICQYNICDNLNDKLYFSYGNDNIVQTEDLSKFVSELILYVSEKLNINFVRDLKLRDSLIQHIGSETKDNYRYMKSYSPFNSEVKNKYPDLFEAVKEAINKLYSTNPYVVNDTFITLICLHFLLSISNLQTNSEIYVMYVCSSGVGATSLLEHNIKKKFANLKTAGFASVSSYKPRLKSLKPDIILTIFPLEEINSIPIIQINPIPNEIDYKNIENVINKIELEKEIANRKDNYKNIFYPSIRIDTPQMISNCLNIYIKLKKYFGNRISQKYEDAFMIHVQLATYRILAGQQYVDQEISKEAEELNNMRDTKEIRKVFDEIGCEINTSEIKAILNYTRFK